MISGLVSGHFIKANDKRKLRLLRVDNVNVQQSFDMRGPRDRKIRLQEVDSLMIYSLDMTNEGKNRHKKAKAFSVWRPDPSPG